MSRPGEWMPDGLSPYEQRVWREIQDYKQERIEARVRMRVPVPVRRQMQRASNWWEETRVGEVVEDVWQQLKESGYLDRAVNGISAALGDTGSKLVPNWAVQRTYMKAGRPIPDLEAIQALDLSHVDEITPRLGRRYSMGVGAEGGVAGFIAGGGTVFAVGGAPAGGVGAAPGLGVVATALAADVVTTVVSSVVLAGHYGAYHGFNVDTDDPREQAFMLGVLGVSSAGSAAAKDLAFTQLRQLAMLIVRRATWDDLNKHLLVKLVDQLFRRLAIRLTKQKLGQALPVLGAGIGWGLNYQLLNRVGRDARMLYRERFLIEKYEIEVPGHIHIEDIEIVADEDEGDGDAPPLPAP